MDAKEKAVLDAMKKEGKPMRPGDIAKKAKMEKDAFLHLSFRA